ncbi:hypothetical protein BY458DRAFT_499114 [Sporodiniella umbellata]|nr:hypothetical protein BY458DRAFT_499114 [Sporodiniella umbellata]
MSSMDLDLSLDDLIKQKKLSEKTKKATQPRKQHKHQQQTTSKNAKKHQKKNNLIFQTSAKVKKPIIRGDIASRLSLAKPVVNKNRGADPSQIIITKAISTQKKIVKETPKILSRMGSSPATVAPKTVLNHRMATQPVKSTISARPVERTNVERSSISIRGRSNAASPSGLSIKGESGPTLVLISGLDRGTNSEDIRLVCEDFGNVLKCEVLRNRMGDSFGEAEVEFSTKNAALDCIAKLDNAKADGQYLRVLLRDTKPTPPRNYAASQISSIISTSSTSSGKMYSDQIASRYGVARR